METVIQEIFVDFASLVAGASEVVCVAVQAVGRE